MIGHGPGDPPDIDKCERCVKLEELADGFRIALLEASKLLQFVLLPTTTDAERAEIYRRAFVNPSGPSDSSEAPPTPPKGS